MGLGVCIGYIYGVFKGYPFRRLCSMAMKLHPKPYTLNRMGSCGPQGIAGFVRLLNPKLNPKP